MSHTDKSNVGARGGEHTGAMVEHNTVMGSWDTATQSCGGDKGLILGHNL